MALPTPPPSLLTDWIRPGALFTVVLGFAAFFWKELKDLRAEQRTELKEFKMEIKADIATLRADNKADIAELKADNRVLNDKLDRLLESLLAAKS